MIGKLEKYNWIALIVIIILGFNLVNPLFFKNSIVHDSPQGYQASDGYWLAAYVYHVLNVGYYNEQPGFITGYDPRSFPVAEQPMIIYAAAVNAKLLSIPYYDAAIFLLFLLLASSLTAIYLVSNKISKLLPYVSLPATLFLFTFPFSAGLSWGFWKPYIGAVYLLIALAFFFKPHGTKKDAVITGLLFAVMILSHPHVALYFGMTLAAVLLHDVFVNKTKLTIPYCMNYIIIGVIGVLVTIMYLFDFYGAHIFNSGLSGKIAGAGYNIGAATPLVSHLGIFWWLAFAGVLGMLFLMKKENTSQASLLVSFAALFFIFMGNVVGFDRVYQFRLVWPLFISLFVGLLILIVVNMTISNERSKQFTVLALFVVMVLYLYVPASEKVSDVGDITSLTEPSYWKAIEFVQTKQGSSVLIVDPTLTQHAVILNAYQKTRYTRQDDALSGVSIANFSRGHCPQWRNTKTGMFSYEANPDYVEECPMQHQLCQFEYIIVHMYAPSEVHKKWLESQIAILQTRNLSVALQTQTALVLRNDGEVCRT